jgi:two-component system NtrC family sensor kinase
VNHARFDADYSLEELLPAEEAGRMCASLGMLLNATVALLDAGRGYYAGEMGLRADEATPLTLELEPIAYLAAPDVGAVARVAAATLLRQILLARWRYSMAAAVHLNTTETDYEELQRQNTELRASEARYVALNAQLEARVAEQVKLIDERQRQLYQAERLASIGQLAAGVAHEINNPIGFVHSNLGAAQQYLDQIAAFRTRLEALSGGRSLWSQANLDFVLEDFADLIKDSIGGVDRVARIVRDLKGFSNVDRPTEALADFNELLSSACNLIESKLAPDCLQREFGKLPPMVCLPGHLSQAFLAVLENARLAIATRGEQGRISVLSRLAKGVVEITISDNGEGIAADALPKVFDPFFTTRPVGQGTGLGLTVTRDILQLHGGTIVLESVKGEGTTVRMEFPA